MGRAQICIKALWLISLSLTNSSRRTLVLDLDETLLTNLTPYGRSSDCRSDIRYRPFLRQFLRHVKEDWHVIVWTAAEGNPVEYPLCPFPGYKTVVDDLEKFVDVDFKFDARFFQDDCDVKNPNPRVGPKYMKNLNKLGPPMMNEIRTLDTMVMVDDRPDLILPKGRVIKIEPWDGLDRQDQELARVAAALDLLRDSPQYITPSLIHHLKPDYAMDTQCLVNDWKKEIIRDIDEIDRELSSLKIAYEKEEVIRAEQETVIELQRLLNDMRRERKTKLERE